MDVGARRLVTAPTAEPFTLAEAKAHLRVSSTSEDALITRLIKGVREDTENYLCRALLTQTWEVRFNQFPPNWVRSFELPYPKLQSVTHIQYRDGDGVLQTMETSRYEVLTNGEPGLVALLPDQEWPVTQVRRLQAVTIEYVCGYGDTAASIPTPIIDGMLLALGDRFENRENFIVGTVSGELPTTAKDLMSVYRVKRFWS